MMQAVFDFIALLLSLYAYNTRGFWFYGLLSYVGLMFVVVLIAGVLLNDTSVYSDNVSYRWLAVDVGLIGYIINDLFLGKRNDTQ